MHPFFRNQPAPALRQIPADSLAIRVCTMGGGTHLSLASQEASRRLIYSWQRHRADGRLSSGKARPTSAGIKAEWPGLNCDPKKLLRGSARWRPPKSVRRFALTGCASRPSNNEWHRLSTPDVLGRPLRPLSHREPTCSIVISFTAALALSWPPQHRRSRRESETKNQDVGRLPSPPSTPSAAAETSS